MLGLKQPNTLACAPHRLFCASILACILAQGLVEQPYILVQTVMYSLIIYWMIGFEPNAAKVHVTGFRVPGVRGALTG